MRIEAKDLQSALLQASKELNCSVVDLKYEILQNSKSGFLGIGRKNSIIEVSCAKNNKEEIKKEKKQENKIEKFKNKEYKNNNIQTNALEKEEKIIKEHYQVKDDKIFNSFHKESDVVNNIEDYLEEIKIDLNKLLKTSNFKIYLVEIKAYAKDSIYIKLDGEDAALMIGKEGHRYKALSYLLHSWINLKYNFLVRLEIAEFLNNQNLAMQGYLNTIIEKVKENGRAQTKPLDGVLIKIALENLRSVFPNKYVGIKQISNQKIIIINDFFKKDE